MLVPGPRLGLSVTIWNRKRLLLLYCFEFRCPLCEEAQIGLNFRWSTRRPQMSWRDNRSFWFKTLVVIVGVLCKNWRNIAWDKQDKISVLRACHFVRDATSSYRAVWRIHDYSINTTGGQKRKHVWCQARSKKADESKGTRFSGTVKCRLSWTSGIFNCCWLLLSSHFLATKFSFPWEKSMPHDWFRGTALAQGCACDWGLANQNISLLWLCWLVQRWTSDSI